MARETHIDQDLLDHMDEVTAEVTPQAATARALPATKYIVDKRSSTLATKTILVIVSLIGLYLAFCAYQNFVRTGNICPGCSTHVSAPASTQAPTSTPATTPSAPRTVGNSAYCVKPDGSATQWLAHGTGTAIGNNGLRYTRCAAQAARIQVATAGVARVPSTQPVRRIALACPAGTRDTGVINDEGRRVCAQPVQTTGRACQSSHVHLVNGNVPNGFRFVRNASAGFTGVCATAVSNRSDRVVTQDTPRTPPVATPSPEVTVDPNPRVAPVATPSPVNPTVTTTSTRVAPDSESS